MIKHVNNYVNTEATTRKCLPELICKIITHKITKTTPHVYCNSQ